MPSRRRSHAPTKPPGSASAPSPSNAGTTAPPTAMRLIGHRATPGLTCAGQPGAARARPRRAGVTQPSPGIPGRAPPSLGRAAQVAAWDCDLLDLHVGGAGRQGCAVPETPRSTAPRPHYPGRPESLLPSRTPVRSRFGAQARLHLHGRSATPREPPGNTIPFRDGRTSRLSSLSRPGGRGVASASRTAFRVGCCPFHAPAGTRHRRRGRGAGRDDEAVRPTRSWRPGAPAGGAGQLDFDRRRTPVTTSSVREVAPRYVVTPADQAPPGAARSAEDGRQGRGPNRLNVGGGPLTTSGRDCRPRPPAGLRQGMMAQRVARAHRIMGAIPAPGRPLLELRRRAASVELFARPAVGALAGASRRSASGVEAADADR